MSITVKSGRDEEGRLVVELIDSELAYETMEQLIEILSEKFSVKIKDKADGIDERIWFVLIKGKKFYIEYDSMVGFDIIPAKTGYDSLSEEIKEHLETEVKKGANSGPDRNSQKV